MQGPKLMNGVGGRRRRLAPEDAETPFERDAWAEWCDDVQLRRQDDGEAVER
jgi:hypothetical protein